METNLPTYAYASFWDRFVAFVIDCLILMVPTWVIGASIPVIGPFLLAALYKVVFECSEARATPGKRIMKIQVVSLQGETITPKAAAVRYLVSFLSAAFAFLGYLLAIVTEKKQTLHDLIAETVVIEGAPEVDLMQAWVARLKSLFGMAQEELVSSRSARTEREKLDLIEKLNDLRKNGALTDEEYDRRKKEILGY